MSEATHSTMDDLAVLLRTVEAERDAQKVETRRYMGWYYEQVDLRRAADARVEAAERRVKQLESERSIGPLPNTCANPACTIVAYGPGYAECPKCGSPPALAVSGTRCTCSNEAGRGLLGLPHDPGCPSGNQPQ